MYFMFRINSTIRSYRESTLHCRDGPKHSSLIYPCSVQGSRTTTAAQWGITLRCPAWIGAGVSRIVPRKWSFGVVTRLARFLAVSATFTFLAPAAAQQQPIYVHPIKPSLPLFRCDGQRPPIFGAENCDNWRLMKKQERLIDLQTKELEERKRRKP